MNKILISGLVFTFLMTLQINAQNHAWCGMSHADQTIIKNEMLHNRAMMSNVVQTRTGELWLPLKIHVVSNDNGSVRVILSKVYEMLCSLNEAYLDQEIQFFVQGGFNFIESTSLNSNPNVFPDAPINVAAENIMTSNRVNNAINIFIVNDIPTTGGGEVLGFYKPGYDWLVVKNSEVSAEKSSTIIHEMGHFFKLSHPFYGWEEGYDLLTWGDIAPAISPGGEPTELMNGSNCESAADGICDTPPSYNFGTSASCNYSGGVKDPNGVLVDPLEENIMDYFIGCAESFTDGQKAEIANNVNVRTNLHTTLAPDVTPLDDIITIYPINSETTDAYDIVEFSWEPVPGATEYLVEIDIVNSFNFQPSYRFVSGTSVEIEGIFNPDSKYHWRVLPLKDGYYCASPSDGDDRGKFRTGDGTTATNEIKEVSNWKISPNPVSAEQTLNINIETTKSFDAQVSIYSLSGQRIRVENPTFSLGASNYELSVSDLSEGMYILSIESETGVLNEKIVVTR